MFWGALSLSLTAMLYKDSSCAICHPSEYLNDISCIVASLYLLSMSVALQSESIFQSVGSVIYTISVHLRLSYRSQCYKYSSGSCLPTNVCEGRLFI